MAIVHHNTPNRSKGVRHPDDVTLAVIHYTGSMNCAGTLAWFKNPDARVSSQYVIDRDGTIHQFETPMVRLWHAGKSMWMGRQGCNGFSIGFELVGTAGSGFTDDQMDALGDRLVFCAGGTAIRDVVGHEQIAPGRKIDPGPLFDWEQLARLLTRSLPHDTDGILSDWWDWIGPNRAPKPDVLPAEVAEMVGPDVSDAPMEPGTDAGHVDPAAWRRWISRLFG